MAPSTASCHSTPAAQSRRRYSSILPLPLLHSCMYPPATPPPPPSGLAHAFLLPPHGGRQAGICQQPSLILPLILWQCRGDSMVEAVGGGGMAASRWGGQRSCGSGRPCHAGVWQRTWHSQQKNTRATKLRRCNYGVPRRGTRATAAAPLPGRGDCWAEQMVGAWHGSRRVAKGDGILTRGKSGWRTANGAVRPLLT